MWEYIMEKVKFARYEVHYLNDNFDTRVYEFNSKKDANNYRAMLIEHADYLYGVHKDGSKELIEKREALYVADGSYRTWPWVVKRNKNELFGSIVSALVDYDKKSDEKIHCEVIIGNKKYIWNGDDTLHVEKNYGMEEYDFEG